MKTAFYIFLLQFTVFSVTLNAQGTFTNYPSNGELLSVYIGNDTVWLGSSSGVVVKDMNGNLIRNLTVNDGLLQREVNCITKDSLGKYWFGTNSGVSVYDGTNWDNQMPGDITSIAVDTNGNVWCGTTNGLREYNGTSWNNYTQSDGLISSIVSTVQIDNLNRVIVGTDAGFSIFNGTTFTNYSTTNGLIDNRICDMKFNNNKLYIGTLSGLSVFDGISFTNYDSTNGLPENYCKRIDFDELGNLYIMSNQFGISVFDGSTWSYINTANGLLSNRLSNFKVLEYNKFLFGYTDYLRSYIYDNGALSLFHESYPYPIINDIVEDNNGDKWLSSFIGVSKMSDSALVNYYVIDNELIGSGINDLEYSSSGDIWAGGEYGLNVYRNNNWVNYQLQISSGGEFVGSVFCDHNGNIWVASHQYGISVYDGMTWTRYDDTTVFAHYSYLDICEDFDHNIWLGTDLGLIKFNGTAWTFYTTSDGLVGNFVYALCVDANNRLWIGTYSGISVFDGNIWENYTTVNGLSSNHVSDIEIDDDNVVWIATQNAGLCSLSDTTWSYYNINDGLLDNEIFSVCIAGDGEKWIGVRGGVSVLNDGGAGPLNFGSDVIRGSIYGDENQNGIKDNNEQGLPFRRVMLNPSGEIATTNWNGDYFFTADTGNYIVSWLPDQYWYITSDSNEYHVEVNDSVFVYPGHDFGVFTRQNVNDVSIDITST